MSSPYSSDVIRGAAEDAARLLGYRQIKPQQLRVVKSFLKGHDVFGVLPSGVGKVFVMPTSPSFLTSFSTSPRDLA